MSFKNELTTVTGDHHLNYQNTTPSSDIFYYVFACTLNHNIFNTLDSKLVYQMPAYMTWEEARFLIEKRHGLFDIKQCKAGLTGSYIVGYWYHQSLSDWKEDQNRLSPKAILKPLDKIVLIRKPQRGVHVYVPEKFKNEVKMQEKLLMTEYEQKNEERLQLWMDKYQNQNLNPNLESLKIPTHLSEEQKIDFLFSQEFEKEFSHHPQNSYSHPHNHNRQQMTRFKDVKNGFKKYSTVHPGDAELEQFLDRNETGSKNLVYKSLKNDNRPPSNYICHRCRVRGHWKHHCPTLQDDTFIPLNPFKLPTGIPKTMLKMAHTSEEQQEAMMTKEGLFVMRNLK